MPEYAEGDTACLEKTITGADVDAFAQLTLDTNPLHLDESYAGGTIFGRRVVHGMYAAGLISAVIGTKLPGPGAIYAGQTLRFLRPVFLGDTVTATVRIDRYDRARGRMTLSTTCRNGDGRPVVEGEAQIVYRPIEAHGRR